MTTELEIYSEVKNTLKSYDDAGLIDDTSLRTWLRSEIKRFGSNLMVMTDDIIEVKAGKAKLPQDFWALKAVYKYTPSHYELEDCDLSIVEKDPYFKDTIQVNFNCGGETCESGDYYIKEEISINTGLVNAYYKNPVPLRIKPGFNRKAVDKDCVNLPHRVTKRNNNEVGLLGNYLQPEFRDGFLYIRYRALPMDEEGNIILPETQHDRLAEYLKRYLEYRTVRDILLNNDDPNLANKLQFLKQESNDAFNLAMTESKAGVLQPDVWKTIVNRNRRRHRRFETIFPRQNLNRIGSQYLR